MQSLKALFLLISLTVASSRGYTVKQSNDLTVDEKFVNDVHTAAHDFTESAMLAGKAVAETASTVGTANLNVLKGIKTVDNKIANTLINVKLNVLESLKAATIEFITVLANKNMSLLEQIPAEYFVDLMQSPFFTVLMDTMIPFLTSEDTIEQIYSKRR